MVCGGSWRSSRAVSPPRRHRDSVETTGAVLPDLIRIGDTTFAEATEAILRQVVWANATFKQHQRMAWIDMQRTFHGAEGEWLGDAAMGLSDLVVQDMTVSFVLEERRPGLASRLARFLRRAFGRKSGATGRLFRFARPDAKDSIRVRLHVTHAPGGRFTVRSEIDPPEAAARLA